MTAGLLYDIIMGFLDVGTWFLLENLCSEVDYDHLSKYHTKEHELIMLFKYEHRQLL